MSQTNELKRPHRANQPMNEVPNEQYAVRRAKTYDNMHMKYARHLHNRIFLLRIHQQKST